VTDAKPRRTPKTATASATAAASTADAEASVAASVPAAATSDAPAPKPRARTKKAAAAPEIVASIDDAPSPVAPAKKPAARKKAAPTTEAAATDADVPAAPATGARRPGLPLREPGQTRKRPVKKATDPVGDGSIDPGEPDAFALAMARRIVEVAEDKKAADIVLLDVRALTAVTDYFIICSGMSERQLGAIADGISEALKAEQQVLPLGREGGANAHWVLLDFGAAIVHVMATPEREFYQLEKLWADAKVLLHVL
jgi:ribosome-associated protein